MRFIALILACATMLGSCVGGRAVSLSEPESLDSIHYAKGFSISRHSHFTEVNIRDPWDSTRLLQRYLLVSRDAESLPEGMGVGTVVRVPIERLVIYSSVHASVVELLGESERVVGLCEVRYVDSEILKQRIKEGRIVDLGEATSPNVERIMEIESEVIISSPFKDAGYGPAEKLGIPIIEGADYMERHPLGRVEWLRFYGMLVGAENTADSIFRATCEEYNRLKQIAANVTDRPRLMVERRYGGQWFVPAGDSYNGVLYADAGADYIFKDLKGGGSIPMAFESVFDRCYDADIWLMKYFNEREMSYEDLKGEYDPYSNFGPYKSRRVFACNSSQVPYYEDIPMHPHLILMDYIRIFHPDLLPDYETRYFRPMI